MKTITFIMLATSLLSIGTAWPNVSETLAELLAQIEQVPDESSGISGEEAKYIKQLQRYEEEAVPQLVALLSHPDSHCRSRPSHF